MSLQDVLGKLGDAGLKRAGDGRWMARCPAHDDRQASLSISRGDDGRALLNCHAGCETADIVAGLGLKLADLFPPKAEETQPPERWPVTAAYDYADAKGSPAYRVCRHTSPDTGAKTFRQHRSDGRGGFVPGMQGVQLVLYRLPELLAAPRDAFVFIAEGEKDVDNLARLGLVATTNVGGAGKWRPEYSQALKGRHVVVLPDNDDPGRKHAEQVQRSLAGVAESVRVIALPGLPPKGDVSDWLKAGGTREQLLGMTESGGDDDATPTLAGTFVASPVRMEGEREERADLARRMLSFGVQFLDDAMTGIAPNDLILLGAKTGVGKTALATRIALHNAKEGKRVHYFALEAESREIERRMYYELLANEYYSSHPHAGPIRYLDWYTGALDDRLAVYEPAAREKLRASTAKLMTFYRTTEFTSDDFNDHLARIKDATDLVVLDHLHYVDSADENENRGYKRVVKQIRDSALSAGKPVLVVAHVRKSDRRNDTLIPTIEDFHGSSDVPKMATKAIMIAPAYDIAPQVSYVWPTYMQISKCRLDGTLSRYAAVVNFDAREGAYADEYTLGRLVDGGKAFRNLTYDETPAWARRAQTGTGRLDEEDKRYV